MYNITRCVGRSLRATYIGAAQSLKIQTANLNIQEYQSQQLLQKFGINVPRQGVASTKQEAESVAKSLETEDLIVKAQILAGGRGLGHFDSGLKGGVHICNSVEEAAEIADKMLGHKLITKQTGEDGRLVQKVLIMERQYIRREMYLCIVLDRTTNGAVIIGSSQGGTSIEVTAHENPSAIIRENVDIRKGLSQEQAVSVATKLGFKRQLIDEAASTIMKLYDIFVSCDCLQLEINPFVETSKGEVMCVDAKLNFDDNAAPRQKEIFELKDMTQVDSREVQAAEHDLNFIGLDGNIGCLVNGAGLAMATMDIIKLHNGAPANFLDVGGGATEKQVSAALRIIASDPKVEAILINIFGGIMRCDVIAMGVLSACQKFQLHVPIILRLQGTRMKEAIELVESSGLRVIPAADLDEAAEKAVRAAHIVNLAKKAKLNVSFELPL